MLPIQSMSAVLQEIIVLYKKKMKLIFLSFLLVYCTMREVKGKVSEIESALSFSAQCVKIVLINGHCPFFHAE